MAAWVKLTGPAKDQKIVGNQDNVCGGYKVSIYGNKLELEIRDAGNVATQNRNIEGGTVLEPGVWYHVAATYCQGGSIKTYVNAKLDRELATPSILAPSAGTLKIGREPFADLYWFNGLMDDLQIYNYPLSEAQVAALYSGQSPPTIAQIGVVETSRRGTSRNWIPVSIIVIIAVVIGVAVRRKKTAA